MFASEPKDASAVPPPPVNAAPHVPRADVAPHPRRPAAARSAPVTRHPSAPHFSMVFSCLGTPGEFVAQCECTLAAASRALESAGAAWRDVSGVAVQLADISSFAVFNQCYARCVPQSSPPTRFSVCVSLEEPVLFVISIQVCKSSSRHMHVESLSFWAPANIGPYSQSQLYPRQAPDSSALLLVSGQIALVPERMMLVAAEGGWPQQLQAECAQVSRNLAAVVAANGFTEYATPSPIRTPVHVLLRYCSRAFCVLPDAAACAGPRPAPPLLPCSPLETAAMCARLSCAFKSTLLSLFPACSALLMEWAYRACRAFLLLKFACTLRPPPLFVRQRRLQACGCAGH